MKQAVVFLHDMKNFARLLGSFGSIPTIQEVKDSYEQAFIFTPERLQRTEEHTDVCSQIFQTLNLYHPNDYNRRSLSVGDVIRIDETDGTSHYYMVDNIGFKLLEQ